ETQSFLELAAETDFISGVVGWVDLTEPNIADVVLGLRRGRGGSHLVGVRHQVHDEPDPRWLLREEVIRGLTALAEAGLTYDLLVRARELPAACEVAHRFPEMRFVVDHIAKPEIAAGQIAEWSEAM